MRLARSRTEIPPRFALPPFFKGGKGGIYSPSVMKCTNVVWSDLVSSFCPPQLVKKYVETRGEVMMCADCDFLDSLEEPKHEKCSMYWGGRFTGTKGGERSLQQYLQYVMAGREGDIFITAVGGAKRLDETLKHYGAKDLVKVFHGLPY